MNKRNRFTPRIGNNKKGPGRGNAYRHRCQRQQIQSLLAFMGKVQQKLEG